MKTHRELAEKLDLFHSEPQGPGMIFWHPNGWQLFQNVQEHMRKSYRKCGFKEVRTPQLLKKELWQISGHMDMYSEDMFFGGSGEEQDYALKPMSCPAHILLYKRGVHSYRDLPLRLFEFGVVHRNESSGSLNGSLRLRQFTQDDAHVFCTWSQAEGEVRQFLKRAKSIYADYGYKHLVVKVSTQPEKALGNDSDWRDAEALLIRACQNEKVAYEEQVGEGAFYGPKIELALEDAVGRIWQCGTVQFDFNLPQRFELEYDDGSGQSERPVILHQAVYGSIERWIGILLEASQGKLPEWVHPQPVAILSVSPDAVNYAKKVQECLLLEEVDALIDVSDQSIGRKIKRCFEMKTPNILIIGKNESENNLVTVRRGKEEQTLRLQDVVSFIKVHQEESLKHVRER